MIQNSSNQQHVTYLLLHSKYSPGCNMLFQKHSDVNWSSFCKVISIDHEEIRNLILKKGINVVPILFILVNGNSEQVYQGLDDVSAWMDKVKNLNTQSNQTNLDDLPAEQPQKSMMEQPRYDNNEAPSSNQVPKPTISIIQRNDYTNIKKGDGHGKLAISSLTLTDTPQPNDDTKINLDNPSNPLMAELTQDIPDVASQKNRVTEGKKADIKSVIASMAAERENEGVTLIDNMNEFLQNQEK